MSHITYGRAAINDYNELIDFGNYVFSQAHMPHDFPMMLPKLYKRSNFNPEHHYTVKEDGRIKALVGSYPMIYNVCGQQLKIYDIGIVSVHPYARSKGYMKLLMNEALQDMRVEGADLSSLGGQRQRYEYFGYSPCGALFTFSCSAVNIRHRFGKDFQPDITFKEILSSGDPDLDVIGKMHSRKKAFIERPRDLMFDIMTTWNNRILGVWRHKEMIGYLSVSQDLGAIQELYLTEASTLIEMIGAYLRQFCLQDVLIRLSSYETDKIAHLAGLAERTEVSNARNFNILNYPNVIKAFLKLKSGTLPDGRMTVRIQDKCTITISVADNGLDVRQTDENPDYIVSHLEAMQLFFSHVSAFFLGIMEGNDFAGRLFPIPIFVESNDQT